VSDPQVSETKTFRTLDSKADATTFAVWNDTHENAETLGSLFAKTKAMKPDFLVWNGDQANDLHFEKEMAGQLSQGTLTTIDGCRQPIAQIIGGGPLPKFATFLQGTATKETLSIKMTKLDGTEVANVVIKVS
jgi:hypothetical protein